MWPNYSREARRHYTKREKSTEGFQFLCEDFQLESWVRTRNSERAPTCKFLTTTYFWFKWSSHLKILNKKLKSIRGLPVLSSHCVSSFSFLWPNASTPSIRTFEDMNRANPAQPRFRVSWCWDSILPTAALPSGKYQPTYSTWATFGVVKFEYPPETRPTPLRQPIIVLLPSTKAENERDVTTRLGDSA